MLTLATRVGRIASTESRKINREMRNADSSTAADGDEERAEATEILPHEATHSFTPGKPLGEGTRLGAYLIDAVIGEGGGGQVFAARHHANGKRVAIKLLRPEMVPMPHLVTRFNREVEAINKIRHPNIVQVIETGETSRGQPYYVMELLEGVNLRKLLQFHGRFSPAEVLELVEPICLALTAVHDAGFVHRDVKASNVLVVDNHGERVVKLLDFGIAKMVHGEAGPGLTEPGATLGSAHNMAPEQVRCERLDARADIYAVGVVMFQLLTGEYPYQAEDPRQIAVMHLHAPAPRPSSRAPVSPAVDSVVLRCLEKQASRRYASALELLDGLRTAVGEPPKPADEHDQRAQGIYLELTTPSDLELDDAMMEDMSNVLDSVEDSLKTRGYAFPLRTSNLLLAVRVPPNGVDPDSERGETATCISELRTMLADRLDPHPDVQIVIAQKVNVVRCRTNASGVEIVGGPLLEVAEWTANYRARD
jgi:serine/threonine protein kinase